MITRLMIGALAALLASCTGESMRAGSVSSVHARPPYTLHDAKPPKVAPNILLIYDMEGLSGQSDWRTFLHDYPEQYAEGRERLVADVNAVIDGLFAGGAASVTVLDSHGSGYDEGPDLPRDRLDSRAEYGGPPPPGTDPILDGWFDAGVVVGMHGKSGGGGFAAHTLTWGMDVLFNGRPVTETEMWAYRWGRGNIPLIFASGDDRLREELAHMSWIEYVTTKHAVRPDSAIPRPVDQVQAELRAGAERAVRNIAQAKAVHLSTPVRVGLRTSEPASLGRLWEMPGLEAEEDRVSFTAPDVMSAVRSAAYVVGVASTEHDRVVLETIGKLPGGAALLRTATDSLYRRWLNTEIERAGQ